MLRTQATSEVYMSSFLDSCLPRVVWMAIVSIFGVALPFLLITLRAKDLGQVNLEVFDKQPHQNFRCQPFLHVFSVGCTSMGTAFFLRGMIMQRMDAFLFIGSIGVVAILIGILSTIRLLRSFVVLLDDRLVILKGTRKQEIKFNKIQKVFLISGHIAIDTGVIPRTIIPLMFSNWRELYRILVNKSLSGTGKNY